MQGGVIINDNIFTLKSVQHLTLTVRDVALSQEFYCKILGFQIVRQVPPRVLLRSKKVFLSLTPAQSGVAESCFDEGRVGLDHLSFKVKGRQQLKQAIELFEQLEIPHGEIKDMGPIPIYVLAFRDPNNIQLELTAYYEFLRLLKKLLGENSSSWQPSNQSERV